MNRIQRSAVTVLAAGALFLNTALPAFATTLEISGNGDSENKIEFDQNNTTGVEQSNKADIDNKINVVASTGNNEANRNTGGSVSIKTGDAESNVDVKTNANSNSAEVSGCGACGAGADVLISGNGDGSKNTVNLDVNESEKNNEDATPVYVSQSNDADIYNEVSAAALTGKNEANRNTGGDVIIETGDATVGVDVTNAVNGNAARVGGDENEAGSLSARIVGNGSDTHNKIELDVNRSVFVDQSNDADVDNNIDVAAKTGKNEAERNTGGSVSIETGNAEVTVGVDNMVNFNWAEVDCCRLGDDLVKIAGNGDESKNTIDADLLGGFWVDQDNRATSGEVDNGIDGVAKTGGNEIERSTGVVDPADPSIETGDAMIDVTVENDVNMNAQGAELDFDVPEGPHFNLNLSFDFGDLMDWLLSHQA